MFIKGYLSLKLVEMPEKPSSFYILVKNLRIFVYVKKFDLDDFGWFFQPKLMAKRWKKMEKHKKGKKSTKITDFGWFFQPKSRKIRKKAKIPKKKIWLILDDFFNQNHGKQWKKNWKNIKKARNQPKSQILVDFFNPNPVKLEKRQKSWK